MQSPERTLKPLNLVQMCLQISNTFSLDTINQNDIIKIVMNTLMLACMCKERGR